jgi:hypothetical protein
MTKSIAVFISAAFLMMAANPRHGRFAKYKPIEAYEVRQGVLAMPRYTSDGQVCEIGIERRRYSSGKIFLNSNLSRDTIDSILDEFAPIRERGKQLNDLHEIDLISQVGDGATTLLDYQNVVVVIYRKVSSTSDEGDFAATINWKERKCQ